MNAPLQALLRKQPNATPSRTRLLAFALAASFLFPSAFAEEKTNTAAPTNADVSEKKSDLKELRSQIDTLRKEMTREEGRRAGATDQLRSVERDISATQRELATLTHQRNSVQTTLNELAKDSLALENQLGQLKTQLEQLAYRRYVQGNPDTLQLLFSGENPNQVARDLHYLGIIGKERGELLHQTETLLERKKVLTERTRERSAELAQIEARQKEHHEKLVAQRQERQNLLEKIASKIAEQRKEIGNLQRDEKQLSQLVAKLSRLIAARAASTTPRKSSTTKQGKDTLSDHQKPSTEMANEKTPEAMSASNFPDLQGKLRLPVKGTVTNRFGSPRQEGGAWKGLFIRAHAGSEIKAIAAGQVVFAEWMRGFGNLMIVDHGRQYLTIYGYNDSLLKQVGDSVRGGDSIATAGNSGGNPESGLYFELRHQGQPVDPMRWVNLK